MAQVINTNIMSLNAQRQLNKSQLTQNEAMERLSSGLRINSAKDDAAGLAISTGMQSQIRGINQAVRNSNDGISMAQTAEGSMDEMTNILQRMRELSVQSANDTNSASNREAIQQEVDQLHNELDRIASTTEFNGVKLLDGSSGTTTLQIGANSGETLSFSIESVTTNDLGLNGGLNKGELNGGRVSSATTGTAGEMLINGVDVPASETGSAADIAKAINIKTAETGVTASAYNVIQGDDASATVTGKTDGMTIKVGNADAIILGPTSSMDNLVETINRDVAGVTASVGDKGELLVTNDTGEDIAISKGQGAGIISTDSATQAAISGAQVTLTTAVGVQDGLKTTYDGEVITRDAAQATFDTSPQAAADAATLTAALGVFDTAQGVYDAGVVVLATAQGVFDTAQETALNAAPAEEFSGYLALDSADDSPINVSGTSPGVAGFTNSNGADSVVGEVATLANITEADKLQINGIDIAQFSGAGATPTDAELTAYINSYSEQTGVTMSGTAAAGYQFSAEGGRSIEISSGADTQAGRAKALTALGMQSEMGGKVIDGLGTNVRTVQGASSTLNKIDAALQQISESRAGLGAVQNRLGSTISNLENVSQNLSASNSRIQDADFAAETSKMSKAQILQQAGTSMLSQANASTQNVLSLLQG
ncbi:flagellin N-terminal helical domain-containing protein [Psychromonas sp. Urea-02u-13]|uniref:flagellin N-terminal helical domain-containing protein n=1 Tax=Psychromonas sp. Urea-02u-13 TaxID=2058326 RepID=UPI000C336260|nr:flagellin [Psychromonas sp. Urea-02u-13]PKG39892.1 flagellin [Psychromonas sp. Urea-02u-13]